MEYSHTMDELQLMFGRVCTDQPGEQRVSLLRKYLLFYLKCHVGYMRRPGQVVKTRYSCAEEVALFNGSLRNTEIMNCALPGMTPGNCFQNAFTASLSDPTLRYVEGWAYMEQSYPTHHAWVEHSDGTISDPTWYTVVSNRISDGGHGLIPGFKARGAYIGVSIPRNTHISWYLERRDINLLASGDRHHKGLLEKGMSIFDEYHMPRGELADSLASFIKKEVEEAPNWVYDADAKKYNRFDTATGCNQTWG